MWDFTIVAERSIIVKRTGEEKFQEESLFDYVTKPSDIELDEMLKTENPVEAYVEWLFKLSEGKEYQEPIYDDIWEDGKPVGYRTVNPYKDYAEMVKRKVDSYVEDGWDVRLVY